MVKDVFKECAKMLYSKKILSIIFVILLLPVVVAQEQDVYQLTLKYDKGEITKEQLDVTKGIFFEILNQPEIGYRVELLSFDKKILYEQRFGFALEVFSAPLPEWFDEQGNQIYFPTEEELPPPLETTTKELIFPYFSNGKTINVYDPDGVKVLEIDVSQFAQPTEQIEERNLLLIILPIIGVIIAVIIIIFLVNYFRRKRNSTQPLSNLSKEN